MWRPCPFSKWKPSGRRSSRTQAAVRTFLQQALPDARRVRVCRVTPLDPQQGTWEAEAEVWQPNATIQSLGLRTRRPVLDAEVSLRSPQRPVERLGLRSEGMR